MLIAAASACPLYSFGSIYRDLEGRNQGRPAKTTLTALVAEERRTQTSWLFLIYPQHTALVALKLRRLHLQELICIYAHEQRQQLNDNQHTRRTSASTSAGRCSGSTTLHPWRLPDGGVSVGCVVVAEVYFAQPPTHMFSSAADAQWPWPWQL